MKVGEPLSAMQVENALVRARFVAGEKSGALEFFARGADGWRLLATTNRGTDASGPTIDAKGLAGEFDLKFVAKEKSEAGNALRLEGRCGPHRVNVAVEIPAEGNAAHVTAVFDLAWRLRISSLHFPVRFLPGGRTLAEYGEPDFLWIPHLRKEPGHVVADQIFRSPAAMIQTGTDFAALIPDLRILSRRRRMPTTLDLQLRPGGLDAPLLSYGIEPYGNSGHVYFKADAEAARPETGELRFGFHLLLDAAAEPAHGYPAALRFLWDSYGAELFRNHEPQTAPFEEFARYACDYALHRGGIWTDFRLDDDTPVGGTLVHTYTSRRKPHVMNRRELESSLSLSFLTPILHRIGTDKILTTPLANDLFEVILHQTRQTVAPLIMNQAWFNNLRTAYGLYGYGGLRGDLDLVEKARRMKELALRAPARGGLFASMCYAPEGKPMWYEGSKAFEPSRAYHLPDCAWTAHWMLNWYEDHERDERLVRRARDLAACLVGVQQPSGAIPGWVKHDGQTAEPQQELLESAETAASGLFLAHFGRLMKHEPSIEAAKRAAEFLIRDVFPGNRWWDFETFFSCSKKDVGIRDIGTGLVPHNNLSIGWAAEMFKELHLATGDPRMLEWGRRALDTLCLYQQVWDAPYISINTFGGFGVMNTDGEWNDARQSIFADILLDYYAITREAEYFERGVAALRSSFTLMLAPENRPAAPGNLRRLQPRDYGATYENYAHLGFDRRVPGYVMFDWGSGGACAAAWRARTRYGDVFVDFRDRRAFGVNGLIVERADFDGVSASLRLYSPFLSNRKILIKMIDAPRNNITLKVNGRKVGSFGARALERGVEAELKNPELE